MVEIRLSSDDFGILAICALRYCYGRRMYMPEMVRDIVRPHLSELSDRDVAVMQTDIMGELKRGNVGDRIDVPGWEEWCREVFEEGAKR